MTTFNEQDVWTVARTLEEDWRGYDEGTYSSRLTCRHCGGQIEDRRGATHEAIRHSLNCPVLVARDLLTGAP